MLDILIIMFNRYQFCIYILINWNYQGRIQDFPLGGANPRWRGRQPPTLALFGENICKNERIWSCWGGRMPETFRGVSAFNWWEENCCIFLKKISSQNAFYLFLPLFKQQTTPYNVLFFKKMKKYAFPFSFQTGTGSQWEGPHNSNNKATCPWCLQSRFTHYTLFST